MSARLRLRRRWSAPDSEKCLRRCAALASAGLRGTLRCCAACAGF